MLQILRQMSIEELRYAAAASGAGSELTPEGIVRALCRECNIVGWGFVPLSREDALLEQSAQRLGVSVHPRGPRSLALTERRLFAALMRRAWEAADPTYRRSLLEAAAPLWDAPAGLPELPADTDPLASQAVLDAFLHRPAGLRALASATETVPLIYPPAPDPGFAGPVSVGLGGLRPRADRGFPALFEVLKICWRSRRRMLAERRTRQVQLERQLRQLSSSLEQRAADLRGSAAPWSRNWARGLSVAGGALAATCVQLSLGVSSPIGWMLMAAGIAWGTFAWATQPRPEFDARHARIQAEINAARQQLVAVQQSVAALEES